MTDVTTPALEYAQPIAWHKVRRWRRRMIVAGLMLAAIGFVSWAPSLWRHAQLLYWQRQCLAYAPPATQVMFDPDPHRAVHHLDPWRSFSAAGMPWSSAGEPLIGLLDRTSPRGTSWLIAISLPASGEPVLRARMCTRSTLTSRPKHFRGQTILGVLPASPIPRLYAAQPDPHDASRFSIRYELPHRSGVITGELHDNGTLELKDNRHRS